MTTFLDTPTTQNGDIDTGNGKAKRQKRQPKNDAIFDNIVAEKMARNDQTLAKIRAGIAYHQSMIADHRKAEKLVEAEQKALEKETS